MTDGCVGSVLADNNNRKEEKQNLTSLMDGTVEGMKQSDKLFSLADTNNTNGTIPMEQITMEWQI